MADGGAPAIDGVQLVPLRAIEDARGAVLHMLREGAPGFTTVREVYFSEVFPGVVKGWKRHARMTQRLAVPSGAVRFTLYDDRDGSPTHGVEWRTELSRGGTYALLVIPPGIWYAFRNPSPDRLALIANCADLAHDPAEGTQRPLDDASLGHVGVW